MTLLNVPMIKKADILKALATLPTNKRVLGNVSGSAINLVVNEVSIPNIGYSIEFYNGGLTIEKFSREPYATHNIMTGYERISTKNRDMIRQHLITTYFPELAY